MDNVSLEVPFGAWIQISGRAGSGKTTLLKGIAGLLPADSGFVYWANLSLAQMPPDSRRQLLQQIGMVFQSDALFDSMTVLENVELPLINQRVAPSEYRSRAEKALADVALSHAKELLPEELSGGMKKRAALARAIVTEPLVLLADDPLAGLDPATARTVGEVLETTCRGRTMIVCVPEIIPWLNCDGYYVMKEGKLFPAR